MSYKISDFCRLLGISPDTLRYYERQRLLSARKNPDNSYRTFSKREVPEIWNLLMLRSLDMGIKDMRTFQYQASIQDQARWLRRRERAIEREIRLLEARRRRMAALAEMYGQAEEAGRAGEAFLHPSHPASFTLPLLGGPEPASEEILDQVPRWMACLPFTYFSVEISLQALLDGAPSLEAQLGLGILEENVEEAGLALTPLARRVPVQPCLCLALYTQDLLFPPREAFSPLFELAAQRQMAFCGPACGRVIASEGIEPQRRYLVGFSVPVRPLAGQAARREGE
jgi:DNA-binding transcriptional MerR regulator